MSHTTHASALATLFAAAMALASPALADGRADWRDYAWQKFDIAKCLPDGSGTQVCPAYHQRWDWKRNQWVDIAITITGDSLHLVQRLTDYDPHDQDYVCVTALVLDSAGRDLIAHHQNWQISAGEQLADTFDYGSSQLRAAASVHIGSKQCRKGAGEDDRTYAAVLAGIGN